LPSLLGHRRLSGTRTRGFTGWDDTGACGCIGCRAIGACFFGKALFGSSYTCAQCSVRDCACVCGAAASRSFSLVVAPVAKPVPFPYLPSLPGSLMFPAPVSSQHGVCTMPPPACPWPHSLMIAIAPCGPSTRPLSCGTALPRLQSRHVSAVLFMCTFRLILYVSCAC
jgi:hypothetical protein